MYPDAPGYQERSGKTFKLTDMCLSTLQNKPRIAKSRIAVWKVIDEYGYPPYMVEMKYEKGLNVANGNKDITEKNYSQFPFYQIHGGFLHAYTKKCIATDALQCYIPPMANSSPIQCGMLRKFKAVKMYIPVGAEYYKGFHGEICATQFEWE